ncbi:hypothetical protein HU200_034570 [Digitaria exilis]|uniref:DUF295 domain-containing protein n=1 Tax=Digitaria exilis TaxID=1010633 RepID=A0A835BVE2_9POAL|nr:hypothetical protein HU200_034570 [Digitaria exilis]
MGHQAHISPYSVTRRSPASQSLPRSPPLSVSSQNCLPTSDGGHHRPRPNSSRRSKSTVPPRWSSISGNPPPFLASALAAPLSLCSSGPRLGRRVRGVRRIAHVSATRAGVFSSAFLGAKCFLSDACRSSLSRLQGGLLAQQMAEGTGPSWSDLPVELAGKILGRLPALSDRVRFAAVCPQWRAAALQGRLPPPMPLLLLPDATVYSLPGSEPFHFSSCVGHRDACGDWLVFSGEDGFFLRNPLSNATVTLPPLSRIRVQHVGEGEAGRVRMEMCEGEELFAPKIMFCSPHLVAATVRFRTETRIAVCQPGATSYWSVHVDHSWIPLFIDMVHHQGKLCSISNMGALLAIDVSVDHSTGDPSVSQIQEVISGILASQLPYRGFGTMKVPYLVESCGVLLCVWRMIDLLYEPGQCDRIEDVATEQNRFEVYEANFEESRWDKVTTLGDDQVLFLHQQCSRSVSISYNEMAGDRIFFMDTDKGYYVFYRKEASSSCRVYDMRDGKVSTPLPMVSWKQPGKVIATWIFPSELN